MRRALVILAVLITVAVLPAMGATIHVAPTGGTCAHMTGPSPDVQCSADTAQCGTTFTAGAATTNPCCQIQQGETRRAASDTLEIHAGTYTHTGFSGLISNWYAQTINMGARIQKSGTVINAFGETYLMDLGGTREIGLWIDADNVTVDGAACTNELAGVSTHRLGCVTFGHNTGSWPIVNGKLYRSTMTSTTTSTVLSGQVGFRIEVSGDAEVAYNTVTGKWGTGFLTMGRSGASGTLNIHHNTLSSTQSGPATCFIFEGDDGLVLNHDNSCITIPGQAASRYMYPRDNGGKLVEWNNYSSGFGIVYYLQDSAGCVMNDEMFYSFNNTHENCTTGVHWWANYYRAHFRNNIFKCGTAIRETNESGGGCTPTGGIGATGDTSDFTNNAFTGTFLSNTNSLPVPIGTTPSPGTNISNNCSLDATTHDLTSASTACIGAGTSNPINICSGGPTPGALCQYTSQCGSGGTCVGSANSCLVSGVSCLPDYQGDVRPKGLGWDLGRDERASATPVCGDGTVDPGETCDDGNTVTETSCAYQTGCPNTCTRCNSSCSLSLSLSGGCCGDASVTDGEPCDGLLYAGGSDCLDVGCSAGGPPGCSACTLTTGACTSCGVPPKNDRPWQYNDADTLASIYFLSSNDGPVGSYLSIFGDDFGATQGIGNVTLGGTSASVVSWSDKKIVVTVPTVATGPRLVAVTPNGGTSSGGFTFTVNSGRIRHLDMDAASGGTGTSGSPWNTFAAANSSALPGDHIIVHEGTYIRTPAGTVDTNWNSSTGGTSGNAITYYAMPGNTVIVDGVSVIKTAIRFSAPFVNIVGVVATGSRFQNVYTDGLTASSTDCRIVDSEVKNGNGSGFCVGGVEAGQRCDTNTDCDSAVCNASTKGQGINFTGARSEALGNYVHDNYSHGMYVHGDDLVMGYNYVAKSGCCGAPTSYGYGIQLYKTSPGPAFFRNRIFRNFITTSNRSGIVIGDYSTNADVFENVTTGNDERGILVNRSDAAGALPTNTTIRNNVFFQDGVDPAGWYEVELLSGAGATVVNNDITRTLAIAANNGPGMTGTVRIDYNNYDAATTWKWNAVTRASLALWRTASSQDTNGTAVPALHVNTSSLDFRLQSSSPLIDDGETATCAHPVQGTACDMGAFEFTPAAPSPAPPTLKCVTVTGAAAGQP